MMRLLALGLVRLYQLLVSPLLPPACRFWPTCSRYSVQAIDRHGVARGVWLSLRRLSRCHPFHPGGYDPVT
jgi:putative membrane protein insertion efficiency factor